MRASWAHRHVCGADQSYPSLPHGILPESGGVGGAQASTVSKGVVLCAQSSARASAHFSGENLATNISYYGQQETFPFSTSLWLRNSLNGQQNPDFPLSTKS